MESPCQGYVALNETTALSRNRRPEVVSKRRGSRARITCVLPASISKQQSIPVAGDDLARWMPINKPYLSTSTSSTQNTNTSLWSPPS